MNTTAACEDMRGSHFFQENNCVDQTRCCYYQNDLNQVNQVQLAGRDGFPGKRAKENKQKGEIATFTSW